MKHTGVSRPGERSPNRAKRVRAAGRLSAALLVAAFAAPGAAAQETEHRMRMDVRLVLMNTYAASEDGQPVLNLRREDFRLFENARAQEIAIFAGGDAPVHIALVMDTSGSIADSFVVLQQVAQRFIRKFQPDDKLAVYEFGPDVMRLAEYTTDRDVVVRALQRALPITQATLLPERRRRAPVLAEAKPPGGTMLYDCLAIVADEFPRDAQRRVILLFTDGLDNASLRTLPELSRQLLGGSTVVYAVMPQVPPQPVSKFRAETRAARKKWTLILDVSAASPEAEKLIRATAVRFLDELDPKARVWLIEYRKGLQVYTYSEERVSDIDSHGVYPLLTPTGARDALLEGRMQPQSVENFVQSPATVESDQILVLTDSMGGGLQKLPRERRLDYTDVVILSPEYFPEPSEQELVIRTLLKDSMGLFKAKELAIWMYRERTARGFRELVTDTGGAVMPIRRVQDLEKSYAHVAELIRSSYTLGYYTNAGRGRHQLRVETPGKSLTVRSRRVLVIE